MPFGFICAGQEVSSWSQKSRIRSKWRRGRLAEIQIDHLHRRPHLTNNSATVPAGFEVMDENHEPGERPYSWSIPQTHASAEGAARLSKWLTQDGRFLAGNRELLDQFCAKVIEAGVPLSRSWLHIRTLHPEFAGVSRVWRRGMQTEERFLDFGFEKWPAYLNSPVRHVVEERRPCRWRLNDEEPLPFPVLEEHRAAGYVDYAIAPMIFSDGRVNAISWATDRPGGFSDGDLRLFEEVLPTYSTVVEVKSLRRFATNVLSTYVGREPGELIMNGQIRRGDV